VENKQGKREKDYREKEGMMTAKSCYFMIFVEVYIEHFQKFDYYCV